MHVKFHRRQNGVCRPRISGGKTLVSHETTEFDLGKPKMNEDKHYIKTSTNFCVAITNKAVSDLSDLSPTSLSLLEPYFENVSIVALSLKWLIAHIYLCKVSWDVCEYVFRQISIAVFIQACIDRYLIFQFLWGVRKEYWKNIGWEWWK